MAYASLFRRRVAAFVALLGITTLFILAPPTSAQNPTSAEQRPATANGTTDLSLTNTRPPTTDAVLNGLVLDADGAAVSGASVVLQQLPGGAERAAVTDATGIFRFADVSAGKYRLLVNGIGFSNTVEEIAVAQGETRNIELTLRPGTIKEQVTVTATRSETLTSNTAVPVSIVERDELERKNLTTVGDIFRYLPGTTTVNEGAFQVRPRIRGLDSNRVLILVDGERLNNARTSTSNSGIEIGLVDLGQIESVEVARGSGSVLYGTDALGGTINIITRDTPPRTDDGFRFGGGFDGFFSSNETGRRGTTYLTGAHRRFAFRIAQTLDRFANYHSGAVPLASGGEDARDAATEVINSQSHASNTQLVGRFFFDDRNAMRFSYERRRAADIGVPATAGVFTAFFPFSNRDKFSARYEAQALTPNLTRLSILAYYQTQNRNFSNTINVPAAPPFFPGSFQFSETVTRTATAGFDAQSNWTLGQRNTLTAGASYFRDRNRDTRFIERLSPNFRTNPPSLVRSEDRSKSVPDATFADLAFFAQNEFAATRRLRFIVGARLDRFRIDAEPTTGFNLPPVFTPLQIEDLNLTGLDAGLQIRDTAASGDAGIVFKPVEAISLTARVGRSFREPNLFERFFTDFGSVAGFVVGNPNLKPESGVNIDAGVKFNTARFAGSLTYFNNTYTNFLTSRIAVDRTGVPITIPNGTGRPPIQVFRTVNEGRTRIQGIEAELETPFRVGGNFFSLFGNVSYLKTVHK